MSYIYNMMFTYIESRYDGQYNYFIIWGLTLLTDRMYTDILVICVVVTLWLIWNRATAFHQQNYNPKTSPKPEP